MVPTPLIALICATPLSLPPILRELAAEFATARPWTILDDRLLAEAEDRGGLTAELEARMRRLVDHAVMEGADGIVLTCSMYSDVARRARPDIGVPIFGPDDAAFAAVLDSGSLNIAVVANSQLAADDAAQRLGEEARRRGVHPAIAPVFASGALEASKAGDAEELGRLVARAVQALPSPVDSVVLAQYSLASAAEEVGAVLDLPVYSGPAYAVAALKVAIAGSA